jgi:dTDP-glucose pyrophosphorylase
MQFYRGKASEPKSLCSSRIVFYDNSVVEIAKNIEPSTSESMKLDVNKAYLEQGKLKRVF